MTPFTFFVAVAIVALVSTALWAVLARKTAVYLSSGLSFTTWSWLAIVGGDVAMISDGQVFWIRQSTASVQFVALALAVISLVAFSMRLMGAYPSPQENAAESESNRQTTG